MARSKKIRPRLRVLLGSAIAMGPGKADLLEAIGRTGSISGAARKMGMSYRRAWLLVEAMNQSFREPLVDAAAGGRGGGGAEITRRGHDVLRRYREMEDKATTSVSREMDAFSRLLNKDFPRD